MENCSKLLIAIPTYNRFNSLKCLLRSLYELPNYIDCDIVVFNDNPTDNKVIRSFINKLNKYTSINRFKSIDSSENLGIYLNRARIVDYSINNNYDYLLMVDDDDLLNTICILNWYKTFGVFTNENTIFVFDVVEFYHNLSDGSNQIISKFIENKSKSVIQLGISGSIFSTKLFSKTIEKYKEYLNNFDLSKTAGEDQVFLHNLIDVNQVEYQIINEPLYYADYDKSNDHMLFVDKSKFVPNLKSIKTYIPNTIANGE